MTRTEQIVKDLTTMRNGMQKMGMNSHLITDAINLITSQDYEIIRFKLDGNYKKGYNDGWESAFGTVAKDD